MTTIGPICIYKQLKTKNVESRKSITKVNCRFNDVLRGIPIKLALLSGHFKKQSEKVSFLKRLNVENVLAKAAKFFPI